MQKQLFVCILLFFARVAVAQAPFENGYVIKTNGDTLKGQIKDRKYVASAANPDKIKFVDSAHNEMNLDPYEIKEYCKKGTHFYRSLPIGLDAKLKFAEIVEYGNIILFGYTSVSLVSTTNKMMTDQDDLKKLGDKISARSGTEYFLQKRKDVNSLMKIKSKNFQETAVFFFQNDLELVKKIQDGTFKYEDLKIVVRTYNQDIEKK